MTKAVFVAVVLSVLSALLVGCSGSDMPTTPVLEAGCTPVEGVRTCVVLPTQAAPVQVKVVAPVVQVKVEPTVAPLPKAVGETFDLATITVRCGQLAGNDVTKVASCVKCLKNGAGSEYYASDNECYVPKK